MASSSHTGSKQPVGESLSKRINESTLSSHAHLNRMITTCLPLALPPHTTDSSTYLSGILHIAPIYLEFEKSWDALLEAPWLSHNVAPDAPSENGFEDYLQARRREVTRRVVLPMRVPGLRRSERLRSDVESLTGYTEKLVSAALASAGRLPNLKAFTTHIELSVERNPHVLLAYAWVMYMAIFSGGRYLRASLQDAGEGFWTSGTSGADGSHSSNIPAVPLDSDMHPKKYGRRGDPTNVIPGLSFFHFPGDQDGEDIKIEFKRRFAEAELLLSDAEKDDVVREAHIIFDSMGSIVKELDFMCRGTDELETLAVAKKAPSSGGLKQSVRQLMKPLGRQFSTIGPKSGTLASIKHRTETKSRSGALWSLSFLCSVVAVGSAAWVWRSVDGSMSIFGFNAQDTTA